MTEFNKIGVVAGSFDVIHPGYIAMFEEMEKNCDQLVIFLQGDPTIDRPEKLKPVLSLNDRHAILKRVVWHSLILTYNTEEELYFLLKSVNPDVRFLGDDYVDKPYTGQDLNIPIHWISRSHGWSTTKFKKLIAESL